MTRRIIPLVILTIGFATVLALTAHTQQPQPIRIPPTGNVRDHGARGNGMADDWAAIQNAVDGVFGTIYFPPGTYRISRPIEIDLRRIAATRPERFGLTSIRGDGVVRVVMAGEGPAFKFIGSHAGTADPKTVKNEVWGERMPMIEGIEIIGEHKNSDGIEASGTMQLTLSKLLIRRCRHGIHFTDRNRNVIIANSHIYQNHGTGIYMDEVNLHQINVIGCHVSYCDEGGIVCRGGEVRNLQITGCDIESNQGEQSPPTANVLIDSTGGSNAEVAITGNTIQHNHNAPGSANIRIKGPSARRVKDAGEELRDGHVTITGNVLSDVKVNVHVDGARGVVIAGNTFWTAYENNLLVEHSAYVTVGANNFDRNPRYASEEKPETTNAIVFRDCADCTLSGFTLSLTRRAPAAITLEKCNRVNLTGATILDSDDVGLLMKDVTNSRVAGCLIRDDRADAKSVSVRVIGGKGNMIVDNYLGRPFEIPKGVGLVERNYDGKE
jgi:hypothetical protein